MRRPLAQEGEQRGMELAARLRAARQAAGVSQSEAAAAVELLRPAMSLVESGVRHVRALKLITLARLYGVPVENLVEGL